MGDGKPGKTDPYITPPVQRAARLIKHIADGDPVENMASTAKTLNVNRTTLLRLLRTLEAEGFVEKRESGSGYKVGIALLSIAARSFFSQDVVQVAMPIVTRLAETTGLSAHLGILDGTEVLYLLRRTPNVPLTSNVRAGTRLPAHATTMGRIMLGHMPVDEVTRLFEGRELQRFSPKTPQSVAELLALVEADRQAGIAWSDAYFEDNISSAAVAVLNFAGRPIGAFNISGPSQVLSDAARRLAVTNALKDAGIEASRRLGWIGPAESRQPTSA